MRTGSSRGLLEKVSRSNSNDFEPPNLAEFLDILGYAFRASESNQAAKKSAPKTVEQLYVNHFILTRFLSLETLMSLAQHVSLDQKDKQQSHKPVPEIVKSAAVTTTVVKPAAADTKGQSSSEVATKVVPDNIQNALPAVTVQVSLGAKPEQMSVEDSNKLMTVISGPISIHKFYKLISDTKLNKIYYCENENEVKMITASDGLPGANLLQPEWRMVQQGSKMDQEMKLACDIIIKKHYYIYESVLTLLKQYEVVETRNFEVLDSPYQDNAKRETFKSYIKNLMSKNLNGEAVLKIICRSFHTQLIDDFFPSVQSYMNFKKDLNHLPDKFIAWTVIPFVMQMIVRNLKPVQAITPLVIPLSPLTTIQITSPVPSSPFNINEASPGAKKPGVFTYPTTSSPAKLFSPIKVPGGASPVKTPLLTIHEESQRLTL